MGFSDGNNTYSNPKSKVQPNLAKAVPAPIKILAHGNLRSAFFAIFAQTIFTFPTYCGWMRQNCSNFLKNNILKLLQKYFWLTFGGHDVRRSV